MLIQLVIALILVGVVLYLINLIPIDGTIKQGHPSGNCRCRGDLLLTDAHGIRYWFSSFLEII
jgi:hypothetical protein